MPGSTSYDFFIAHAGADLAQALVIHDVLAAAGFSVFLDAVSLRLGDNWDTELPTAQAASNTTVVLISGNTGNAWYQREEVAAAIDLARRESHRVIPVVVSQGVEVPYGLRRLHGATALEEQELRDLARRLAREAKTHPSKPGPEAQAAGTISPSSPSNNQGTVLIDASHQQERWGWPSSTFIRAAKAISGGADQRVDTDLAASLSSTEPRGSCVILAQPYHMKMDGPTIDAIDRWVGAGGGLLYLGYYLAAIHHETNPNELAFLLGFEFGPDLLMPPGEHSRTDYQDQAFHDRPEYVVRVEVPREPGNRLTVGVDGLEVASACSLRNIQSDTDLTLASSPASVVEVTGPKTREGYILQIKDYLETGVETPAVVAAWHHGQGKVVVGGSWKLVSNDTADNGRFVANAIAWLTNR